MAGTRQDPRSGSRAALILLLAAAVLFTAGWLGLRADTFRPLTRHMGIHFLLMNLAPLAAFAAVIAFEARPALTGRVLFALAAVQLRLLWAWHFPAALAKLFCLLGALVVFAPRPLYAVLAAGHAQPRERQGDSQRDRSVAHAAAR